MDARPPVLAALEDPTIENKTNFVIGKYDELSFRTDASQWAGLTNASDRQRRQRFEAALSEHDSGRKTSRRGTRKNIRNAAEQNYGKDEMCAYCYVLESGMQEGETLSKCGWCKQVTYCSRECQTEHWKTAHKKECAGRKK
jgi:hypothetical protein